jgi:hypothetical protein
VYDARGKVLEPIEVEFDMALSDDVNLKLYCEKEEIECPCETMGRRISCTCDKTPMSSRCTIGLRSHQEMLRFQNHVTFLPIPQIIDSSPRILRPTNLPQTLTLTLAEQADSIGLVTAIAWNEGTITSDQFTWLNKNQIKVQVPLT